MRCHMRNFILPVLQILLIKQLSVEVSIVTASKETYQIIFFTALSKRGCQNIENDNKVNQGEVRGRPIKSVLGGP